MNSKTNMNNSDYIQLLKYYNIPIPRSKKNIKKEGENILSLKLCKCIKKVNNNNEPRAIGICTKTIFNRKGLTRGKFKCKGKRFVNFNKTKKIRR